MWIGSRRLPRTGRLAPAIAAFQSSIRLAPDGVVGYRNLGTAYYLQGDLAQAAAQFQKALEIEPQPSRSWAPVFDDLPDHLVRSGVYQYSDYSPRGDQPGTVSGDLSVYDKYSETNDFAFMRKDQLGKHLDVSPEQATAACIDVNRRLGNNV